jgi:hypothetical protein
MGPWANPICKVKETFSHMKWKTFGNQCGVLRLLKSTPILGIGTPKKFIICSKSNLEDQIIFKLSDLCTTRKQIKLDCL